MAVGQSLRGYSQHHPDHFVGTLSRWHRARCKNIVSFKFALSSPATPTSASPFGAQSWSNWGNIVELLRHASVVADEKERVLSAF